MASLNIHEEIMLGREAPRMRGAEMKRGESEESRDGWRDEEITEEKLCDGDWE